MNISNQIKLKMDLGRLAQENKELKAQIYALNEEVGRLKTIVEILSNPKYMNT